MRLSIARTYLLFIAGSSLAVALATSTFAAWRVLATGTVSVPLAAGVLLVVTGAVGTLDERAVALVVDGVVRPVPSVSDDLLALGVAPELLGGSVGSVVGELLGCTLRECRVSIEQAVADGVGEKSREVRLVGSGRRGREPAGVDALGEALNVPAHDRVAVVLECGGVVAALVEPAQPAIEL